MQNLTKNSNKLTIIFGLLVIISLIFTYSQRFYFAEFHHSLNAVLDGGNTEANVNFIKNLSLNSTISKVNTDKAEISFQKTTLDQVTNLMTDLTKDKNITYKFYEITPESNGTEELIYIGTNLVLMMFFFLLLQIYFFYKEIQQNVVRIFVKGSALYLAILFSTLALQLGTFTVLSRFYEIKLLDLSLIYIASLIINIIWITFLFVYKDELLKASLNLYLYKLEFQARKYYKQMLGLLGVTAILLSIIFGNEFVVYIVLLLLTLGFVLASFYSVPRIATFFHKLDLRSLRKPKMIKKKIEAKAPAKAKKVEKKNKKKSSKK